MKPTSIVSKRDTTQRIKDASPVQNHLLATGTVASPQNWNRHSYCINGPLAYVDPSGLIWGELNNQAQWLGTKEEMEKAVLLR